MKVLCAIGDRGGADLIQRMIKLLGVRTECLLLQVIDPGPRHELAAFLRGPLHRPPHHGPARREASLEAVDREAGRAAIEEAEAAARRADLVTRTITREGRPERVILEVARETGCGLIVVRAREGTEGHPRIGPASVGHTARFVVDHAECDVLILR